ncbi:autotransporter domain-containing protein [Endozoicomonas sp. Mp262]|uniref:autotransporter domain-containing protein n=1 Tax=Endozoicomonas sp. Mp262 TaxID=2919499 RepID=UPI0021DF754A
MSHTSKLKLSALALSIGMACSVQAAYNPQFSNVYSFGDSLSDMGVMKGISSMPMVPTGVSIKNFTTPGGSTAAGHLANNYGKESTAALEATVNIDTAQPLTMLKLLPVLMAANPSSAINMAKESIKELPNDLAGQVSSLLGQIPESFDSVDSLTNSQALAFAELQRVILDSYLSDPNNTIIDYKQTDGNNFATGGASATSSTNDSTFPLELTKEQLISMLDGSGFTIEALEGMLGGKLADKLAVNFPLQQKTLADQVSMYLDRDGKASSNALYTITAGANDLFRAGTATNLIPIYAKAAAEKAASEKTQELIEQATNNGTITDPKVQASIKKQAEIVGQQAALQSIEENKANVENIIIDSAMEVANQTKRLLGAGAKYVVVTNMPDVTGTPDYINQSEEEKATASEGVNGFNQMLQASLGKSSVIYVDINGFLKTIQANPQKFGFDVAKANQTFCDGSSLLCSPKDEELNAQLAAIDSNKATSAEQKATAKQKLIQEAAKNYIFADGVHPSSAVHKYLADVVSNGYLKAAGYNASMQSLARSGQNELAELFESRRTELVANPLAKGELRPYVNISGSRHDGAEHHNLAKGKVDSVRLYAAMDYGISEQTSGGFMLNVQRDKQDFKQDMAGKQEREAYIAGIYLNQHITDHWSWGFNSYLGKGDYEQVGSYTLGDNSNTNKVVAVRNTSETDSIMVGGSLGANGRYDISGIDLMPRINLNYQYEHIDSYAEKTDTAGAVRFDDTNLKRGELALGLNVSKTFQVSGMAVRPYADLDWRQQLAGDKDQEVNWKTEASTNGYINEVISETDRSFGTVKVGGQVEIVEGLTTQLSYSKKFGSSLSNDDRIMLDMGYTF